MLRPLQREPKCRVLYVGNEPKTEKTLIARYATLPRGEKFQLLPRVDRNQPHILLFSHGGRGR